MHTTDLLLPQTQLIHQSTAPHLFILCLHTFPRRSKISNNHILLVGVLLAAVSPTKLEQVIDIARPGLSTTPHRGGPPHYSHPPTLKSYRATLLRCTIVAENSR